MKIRLEQPFLISSTHATSSSSLLLLLIIIILISIIIIIFVVIVVVVIVIVIISRIISSWTQKYVVYSTDNLKYSNEKKNLNISFICFWWLPCNTKYILYTVSTNSHKSNRTDAKHLVHSHAQQFLNGIVWAWVPKKLKFSHSQIVHPLNMVQSLASEVHWSSTCT